MPTVRDNQNALSTHAHSGSAGDGGTSLGNLVKSTLTDATAPSAPGSGLTVIYTVSGRPHYRTGAAGADTELADSADLHAQTHATAHEPSGADTMAVDAAAGTGSLRTIGSGATQGAAGNHSHTIAVDDSQEASLTNAETSGTRAHNKATYANTVITTEVATVTMSESGLLVGMAYAVGGLTSSDLELIIDSSVVDNVDGVGANTESAVLKGSASVASGSRTVSSSLDNDSGGNIDVISQIAVGVGVII